MERPPLPDPSDQSTVSRKARIDRERVHLLYRQSRIGIAGTLGNAAILSIGLRHQIKPTPLVCWLMTLLLLTLVRFFLIYGYPRQTVSPAEAIRWGRWNCISLSLTGSAWGMAAWVLFPLDSVTHQLLLALLICGLVAGSAMAFGVMKRAFSAFAIPAMLPLIGRLITLPREEYLLVGIMAMLFLGLSFVLATNYQKTQSQLLHLKEDLTDRVAQRTSELVAVNDQLRSENQQRKNVEAHLREERDRLETITGNIGAGLAVISPAYEVVWANRVLKTLFGEVEGRSCFDSIYKGQLMKRCNAFRVIEEGCEKVLQEQSGQDAQGRPIWSQIITTPLRDSEGAVTAALELVLPLTDMKRLQAEKERMAAQLEEARKLEAVATLAGGMAHQFNNALAVIMGYAELLQHDHGRDHDIHTYLSPITRAAAQMSGMTDQLLAYAKGGKYKAAPVAMDAFVRETLALLQHSLLEKVSLVMTLEPLLPWVKIDVTQMQMVLSAVVANAGEAMSQGGTVSIRCERHTIDTLQSRRYDVAAGDYVLLTVGDEGTGMDAQTLQRIFEPFFSTKYQGRGLGMAAVYGIVRNHGGHVTVHSLPGEGTRVNIYLPALQSAAVVTSPLSPARNGLRNQRSSVRS